MAITTGNAPENYFSAQSESQEDQQLFLLKRGTVSKHTDSLATKEIIHNPEWLCC
jgi:hypothetical protein